MSTMDIFGSFAYFLGQWPMLNYSTNPGFCHFQAFIIQVNAAIYYWNAILATNFMLRIVFEYKEHDTERLEKYYHLFAWTIPVVTAFIALGFNMYGPAGPWCWIQYSNSYGNWNWARWAFYYAELWIVMIYSFVCMWLIVAKVSESEKSVAKNVSSGSNNRTKQAKIQGILYICAFLITWVPGTANRIQNAIDPNNPIFALVWLQAFFVPMQGFTNFLVYIHPRYKTWTATSDKQGCVGRFLFLFFICCNKDDDKYLKPEYKSGGGAPNESGEPDKKNNNNKNNENGDNIKVVKENGANSNENYSTELQMNRANRSDDEENKDPTSPAIVETGLDLAPNPNENRISMNFSKATSAPALLRTDKDNELNVTIPDSSSSSLSARSIPANFHSKGAVSPRHEKSGDDDDNQESQSQQKLDQIVVT